MLPAPVLSDCLQSRRTSCQPLRTSHSSGSGRRASVQSTRSLPSPSLVAARAFYLHHEAPIGQNNDVQQRRRSLFEAQQSLRRHSTIAQSPDIAFRVASLNISPVSQNIQTAPEIGSADTAAINIKIEKVDNLPSTELEKKHMAQVENVSISSSAGRIRDEVGGSRHVPFQFSHDHLQEWGHAYLGNRTTADAFINAMSLRRLSLASQKGKRMDEIPSPNLVTIQARVMPKERQRKPFLIQRKLDVGELRASIPTTHGAKTHSPVVLRRSSRDRRVSTQHTPSTSLRRGSTDDRFGVKLDPTERFSAPIRK